MKSSCSSQTVLFTQMVVAWEFRAIILLIQDVHGGSIFSWCEVFAVLFKLWLFSFTGKIKWLCALLPLFPQRGRCVRIRCLQKSQDACTNSITEFSWFRCIFCIHKFRAGLGMELLDLGRYLSEALMHAWGFPC